MTRTFARKSFARWHCCWCRSVTARRDLRAPSHRCWESIAKSWRPRKMDEISLNIVEFIRHADVLNDQTLSVAQLTCLKAIYGLPLDAQERELYERATGRSDYLPIEQNEATVIVGRRGGKTSKIAAPIACYEAFCNHRLNRGERGYVMLIAPVKYQAE